MIRTEKRRTSDRSSGPRRGLMMAALATSLLFACGDSPEQMLSSAKSYLDRRDLSAAGIQLKNALQHDGNLVEARFLLGKVHLAQGDLSGAIKELSRARELGHPADEVQPLLARALIRAGEFDRVLAEFADTKLTQPTAQAAVLGALGDARLAKEERAEAAALYRQALELNADDLESGIGLARTQLLDGKAEEAERALRALIARSPGSGDAHATLSDALQLRGAGDEALAELKEAVRLRPQAINYHYALVSQLLRRGLEGEAASRLEAMKQIAPTHPSTRYLQAFVDFRADRLSAARDGVMEVVKQAPDFLPGQLLAGVVLSRLNESSAARNHFNVVLSRAPAQTLARAMLVSSHLSSGEAERALELMRPLLERPLQDAQLLGLAGQVYLANGDYEAAERYLEQAARGQPDDANARLRLGVARMAGGDAQGGFADFSAASQLDQSAIDADLSLISAHMRRGEIEAAEQALATAERKQPDNPLVHNVRGGVMLAKGDRDAARAAFERALSLNADYLVAIQNLVRLDLMEGKAQAAVARMRALVERNPRNVEAQLALADVQRMTRAPATEVRATLERASAALPGSVPLGLALALHQLEQREFAQALSTAQRIEAANPNDPRAVEVLARAQLASNDRQQAVSSLNRLVTLRPQSIAPLLLLADVHRAGKDSNAAEQALRKALTVQADSPEVLQRLAGLQMERGDRTAALASAKRLQARPGSPAGYVLEGEIQAIGGNWNAAAEAYRAALERKAGGEVAGRLHAALMRAQRAAEADVLASDWLREHPRDVGLRGYLSERALLEHRYADAAALLREMDGIAPNNAMVLNNLAWAAAQMKDPQALEYAQRAQQLAPDNPAIIDTLGMIQVASGEVDSGLANLRRAVTLAPEQRQLQLNLAKALADSGKADEARKEIELLLPRLTEGSPLHNEALQLKAKL